VLITIQEVGIVELNIKINREYRLIEVRAPGIAARAKPGQFVHIKCCKEESLITFLRRPISIHCIHREPGRVSLLIQVKGAGTSWLGYRQPGEILDMLGPLGNGFKIPEVNSSLLLVAGGIGIAPLFFLADEALANGSRVKVLIAAKNQSHLLLVDKLADAGATVLFATEDGSSGLKGTAIDLLSQALQEEEVDMICACGPKGMLAKTAFLAEKRQIPCYVSLEEYMACGVGACRGCATKVVTKDGLEIYQNVCSDGPVFAAGEVKW